MTKPLSLDDLASVISRHAFREGIDPDETASAIITTIHEAGYRIVPVEANAEMIEAAIEYMKTGGAREISSSAHATATWQAMLSASPKIEGSE